MTCYLTDAPTRRKTLHVQAFKPTKLTFVDEPLRRRHGQAVVRVTHASVGATDVMAARGDYLFHPWRGFTPGYDFVGTVDHLPADDHSGLHVGQRVAGVLPQMGAHTTALSVPVSLLAPVPESLDALTAATIPLDAVTAWFALDAAALKSGDILVQGSGGAVGMWVAQFATARGLHVLGTASPRSHGFAKRFTPDVFDYRDDAWLSQVLRASGGGVDAVIDHTGSRAVRHVVKPTGRIVRISFGGRPGRQRSATAVGALTSTLRRHGRPDERVCSAPMLVATRRLRYREGLTQALEAIASGAFVAPDPKAFRQDEYEEAFITAASAMPGSKTVLTFSR